MAILAFAEDFSSSIQLDADLMGTPDSGIYWNRGVHPLCTIDNLLAVLPSKPMTFAAYNPLTTYTVNRSKSNVVMYNSKIYQSKSAGNLGHTPDVSPAYWTETNLQSLKVKSFIWSVEDSVKSALSLNRRLIENQFIYNLGSSARMLTGDYSGWAFEPKGSDYVKIRINQIALQAMTTDPVNIYVVNQGRLIDTLVLYPTNGILNFESVNYTISGKGIFHFVFKSQSVRANGAYNDPLKYDGFVCYPVTGSGLTAEDSDYSMNFQSNGMNLNVSAYLDSAVYLENNSIDLAKFYQAQLEMDFVKMASINANAESNLNQRGMNNERTLALLATEGLNSELNTIARNYLHQKKAAIEVINKTFDRFLTVPKGFSVTRRTI
jgi:hypothetical protein